MNTNENAYTITRGFTVTGKLRWLVTRTNAYGELVVATAPTEARARNHAAAMIAADAAADAYIAGRLAR